jgi:hypothetical protein
LGAFLLASLLHFYSGQPLQNLSGVDSIIFSATSVHQIGQVTAALK